MDRTRVLGGGSASQGQSGGVMARADSQRRSKMTRSRLSRRQGGLELSCSGLGSDLDVPAALADPASSIGDTTCILDDASCLNRR